MSIVNIPDLLKAGLHFGHRSQDWNPAMKAYIYGEYKGLHIINLEKTLPLLCAAIDHVKNIAQRGGTVVFVGTKFVAQDAIKRHATACQMPYVERRWLGGTLTNFSTIRRSVKREQVLRARVEQGDFGGLTKKERLNMRRDLIKLQSSIGGIVTMDKLPDAILVIDVEQERIAIKEANKLKIPVIGLVDTNSSPHGIDFMIPGNDDAYASVEFLLGLFADVIEQGRKVFQKNQEDKKAKIEAKGPKISITRGIKDQVTPVSQSKVNTQTEKSSDKAK